MGPGAVPARTGNGPALCGNAPKNVPPDSAVGRALQTGPLVAQELLPPPLRSTDCEVVPMIEQFYEGMLAQKPVHMRKVATESSPLSAVGGLEYPAAEEEEQPPAYDRFAIHFGAGKIGRGFIGLILSNSGYHVTFADVDKHMVNLLSRLQTYKVHVVADRREQFQVSDVHKSRSNVLVGGLGGGGG